MRGLAVLVFFGGLGFFLNALQHHWALGNLHRRTDTRHVVYDVVGGFACWFVSWLLIAIHRARVEHAYIVALERAESEKRG